MDVVLPLARVLVLLALDDLARLDALVAPLAEQLGPELQGLGGLRGGVGAADRHAWIYLWKKYNK